MRHSVWTGASGNFSVAIASWNFCLDKVPGIIGLPLLAHAYCKNTCKLDSKHPNFNNPTYCRWATTRLGDYDVILAIVGGRWDGGKELMKEKTPWWLCRQGNGIHLLLHGGPWMRHQTRNYPPSESTGVGWRRLAAILCFCWGKGLQAN